MFHMEHLIDLLEIQFEQLHAKKLELANKIIRGYPEKDIEAAKWGINAIKRQIEFTLTHNYPK